MAIPTTPPFLPDVLGTAADVRDILDSTPAGSGQISYQSGFPAITAIPLTAGGVAPQREDFNAVNKLFSQHIHFQQSGSVYPWKDSLDYIVGGHVYGYDKNEYACIKQCGPNTADGAQNPIYDTDAEYWVLCDPKQIAKNTLDISKLVKRVDDVTDWKSIAVEHDNIYRGADLLSAGHFGTMQMFLEAVSAGDFSDIYIGDYVTATYDGTHTTKFRVAAINLLNSRTGSFGTTAPNLCIVPDTLGTGYMNTTNTTSGGYAACYMHTTKLPALYKTIGGNSGSPFYGHVLSTYEDISSAMNSSAISSSASWLTGSSSSSSKLTGTTLVLMSEVEVLGATHYSSSACDSLGVFRQLPLFKLTPLNVLVDEAHNDLPFWTRSIADSTRFCCIAASLAGSGPNSASMSTFQIRPRFFIG